MNAGYELVIDAAGCCPDKLRCLSTMRRVCSLIVAELDLHVVGEPMWHSFPEPGGVTGMYLLTESHLTCHTFPEFELATLNLYCCRTHPDCDWDAILAAALDARDVTVRRILRGVSVGVTS